MRLRVATWNMDHWKRMRDDPTGQAQRDAWTYLAQGWSAALDGSAGEVTPTLDDLHALEAHEIRESYVNRLS